MHELFSALFLSKCLEIGYPCRVGLVVSASSYHTVGREFASQSDHTKDHRNGTNCIPAWHAVR